MLDFVSNQIPNDIWSIGVGTYSYVKKCKIKDFQDNKYMMNLIDHVFSVERPETDFSTELDVFVGFDAAGNIALIALDENFPFNDLYAERFTVVRVS